MKYAAKLVQKEVPDGFRDVGRFWGVYGDRTVHPLVEASCWSTDREWGAFQVEAERKEAERNGKRVFEHPYGFLAFPARR